MDAKNTLGQPRILISREALLHNAAMIRKHVGPNVKICAMIKADAYGHGADIVADTLTNFSTRHHEAPMVDALAVASIDEAERLGSSALPVYVLRPVENCFLGGQKARIELAVRNGWILTLCSAAAADDVARIAGAMGRRALVQIMLDTGLTRSGVCAEELREVVENINTHAALKLVALATHFSNAEDATGPVTVGQLDAFGAAINGVTDILMGKVLLHVGNSAAVFGNAGAHLDMVRPGLALYGIDPWQAPSSQRMLKPVMRWTAPLVQIHNVAAGVAVGYGQTWRAEKASRIGLVPVGYADGYPRGLSNAGTMMVHGKPCAVVGRVSMDLTTIDLTNAPHATLGEEVTILDDDPLSPASVYEMARLTGTIAYEIMSRIGGRIHRVPVEISSSNVNA